LQVRNLERAWDKIQKRACHHASTSEPTANE
jgi:hypothetical protein